MAREIARMRAPLALAVSLAALAVAPAEAMAARWTIMVESLAPMRAQTSQPMSRPVVVIHDARVDVWERGGYARRPVWAIAEDGDPRPAIEAYSGRRGVGVAADPVLGLFPGERRRFSFRRVPRRYDRITILQMLGNTNDGFTGIDAVELRIGGRLRVETTAWDAGSERNNQLREFVPGLGAGGIFMRDPERRRIRRHRGIGAYGDMDPAIQGWTGPIARYTVRRSR